MLLVSKKLVQKVSLLVAGTLLGVMGSGVAATVTGTSASSPAASKVAVVLHRFDIQPGKVTEFNEWIDFLHAHHAEAVATLDREKTYVEAMFTSPDEPHRLYWITVQGTGGSHVDTSSFDVDRKHMQYMSDVLVKGSHARFDTRNVLIPGFVHAAIVGHEAFDTLERPRAR